jgi:ribosome biogenesis GTPase
LKGVLKREKMRSKNLIAVGDFVHFSPQQDGEGSIVYIEERHSILSRADHLHRRKEQLIAVNIDQVLIVGSVVLPSLKPSLIDRYIIAARKGHMQPIIVINKIDLLKDPLSGVDTTDLEEERKAYDAFHEAYSTLGIPLHAVSTVTGEGMSDLKRSMRDKASVFSGQSGVGKSSLINALIGTTLAIGSIVAKTSKGSHTTSTAHLIPLEEGGFCIDTPGIKSFGLWDLDLEDVQAGYPDILSFAKECRFPNCRHMQEPDCAVKRAAEERKISSLRLASYHVLLESLEEEKDKWYS